MFRQLRESIGGELPLLLRAFDWDEIRAEVEDEARAQIAIIGRGDVGKSTLFNWLKGWDASPVATKLPGSPDELQRFDTSLNIVEEDFGHLKLVTLPEVVPDSSLLFSWPTVQMAHLLLFMLDGAVGLTPTDFRWFCRLRASGKPIVVALNKMDTLDDVDAAVDDVSRKLATSVIPISALEGTNIIEQLFPAIVDAHPQLAVALGREVENLSPLMAARSPSARCLARS